MDEKTLTGEHSAPEDVTERADRPVLRLTDVSKSYGTHEAVKSVSLDVRCRERICIVGPSGSGKSTFLRCCNLLETPSTGVKIVMGTDSTGTICPFGQHALELECHVEAGMAPAAALATATVVAAEALGIDDEQGTLEPGKIADMVVVDGDPLTNIGRLRAPGGITGVYREGVDVTSPWPLLEETMRAEEQPLVDL